MKEAPNTIYDYVVQEETAYEIPITVIDGYEWNMKEHIRLSVLYKNSQFAQNNDDRENKPFKNIVRPLLNLQYRAEGFDVKDIELFIDESKKYYKSFILRKYHEKWARENDVDTLIDQIVESYVDFGAALLKNPKRTGVPELVPLQSLAFADQTDLLGGPMGILHYFSVDRLREMEAAGWGDFDNGATVSIEEFITLLESQRSATDQTSTGQQNKTTGKYAELYEVHGTLPESYLYADGDPHKYIGQMQIVGFYYDQQGNKNGVTLFAAEEPNSIFKLILRDEVYGRALGFGGAEELFEPQIWTNYDEIRKLQMLDAASKIIYKTTDQSFEARNNLYDAENNEVFVLQPETDINQIDTTPRNVQLFDNAIVRWEDHARMMASANESIMGEQPPSGTPFRLQELVTAESHSLHEYRRGKLATFMDGVYRDWIIPQLAKEVSREQEFIAEFDMDELQELVEKMTQSRINKEVVDKIMNGEIITREEVEQHKVLIREELLQQGNKRFMKILDKEMKNAPLQVRTNIVGKQKNLPAMTEKLVNVFRTIVANPQVLQNPGMAKLFNEILESSGLSPINFAQLTTAQPQQQQQPQQQGQPQEVLPTLASAQQ